MKKFESFLNQLEYNNKIIFEWNEEVSNNFIQKYFLPFIEKNYPDYVLQSINESSISIIINSTNKNPADIHLGLTITGMQENILTFSYNIKFKIIDRNNQEYFSDEEIGNKIIMLDESIESQLKEIFFEILICKYNFNIEAY